MLNIHCQISGGKNIVKKHLSLYCIQETTKLEVAQGAELLSIIEINNSGVIMKHMEVVLNWHLAVLAVLALSLK